MHSGSLSLLMKLPNKELLSLVLRYVDCDTGLVREDLTSFLECDTGVSGHCLAEKITSRVMCTKPTS